MFGLLRKTLLSFKRAFPGIVNVFSLLKTTFISMRINVINFIFYGKEAPKHCERIWVQPLSIRKKLDKAERSKAFGRKQATSGKVIGGVWEEVAKPLNNNNAKWKHWCEGISWKKTGVFERKLQSITKRGVSDGCYNYDDLVKRYERLDRVFEQVKKEGRFRTQEEVAGEKRFFAKGRGEIEVYVGSDGSLYHGNGGNNRLAIAQILKVNLIPAKIGVVHPEGIKHLKKFRLTKEQLKKYGYS